MKNNKVLVTGVSGTGKTTVCRELEKRGINTIGIDETVDLSYWVHKHTKEKLTKKADFSKEFLSTYEWVCDLSLLGDLVNNIDGLVVICGNVENISELMNFCDITLLLVCSSKTFLSRIDSRDDNEYGQNEDAKNFILSYYENDNQKCINAGAIVVDAEQSIEKVVEDIMQHIK